jgi:hypothetical protein
MMILEIEALNLGDDTRAVGLELVHSGVEREPITGREAAAVGGPSSAVHCPWGTNRSRFPRPG